MFSAPNWPTNATQALIQRVTEEVEAETGVELDQLINPAKVSLFFGLWKSSKGLMSSPA